MLKKTTQILLSITFLIGLASALTPTVGHATAATPSATEVFSLSGVKGGLIVHLGSGDGRLTAALRANEGCLVHGLDTNQNNIDKAREYIRSLGIYGKVAIDKFDGEHLPYTDNCVNLLVAEALGKVPITEIQRVLAPAGVACVRVNGKWRKTLVKPWPEAIDEWTHYLHGPDGNAVADDELVGPPHYIQWVAAPKYARHHNHLSSTSAMVSARGRVFSIMDMAPALSLDLPPEWFLFARDAFNGVALWKRPIGPWEGHLRRFRSGPNELQRRLVAVGDRVYVTLGYLKPLVALDAATGETLRTYPDTEDAIEILFRENVLYLVLGDIDEKAYQESREKRGESPAPSNKRIRAVNAATGKLLWEKSGKLVGNLMPTTLCLDAEKVFFQNAEEMVCLNAATGAKEWSAPCALSLKRLSWSTPTMVVNDGVVLCADRALATDEKRQPAEVAKFQWTVTPGTLDKEKSLGELVAYSTRDGKRLWSCPSALGYNSPTDVFVADGLVWVCSAPATNTTTFTEGRDPKTGQVKRKLETAFAWESAHHHRCYRNKATNNYILLGRTGVEFISLDDKKPMRNHWVRGACQYGVMPSNGLLYLPPHSCACYIQSKLTGFQALAARSPNRDALPKASSAERLEKGPLYGKVSFSSPPIGMYPKENWHTYRHDPERSGKVDATLPIKLKRKWKTQLQDPLTPPVSSNGYVCVASVDAHQVHLLNPKGEVLWSFTAGARIDSPPTLYNGLILFGSADGYVYCLHQNDGALIWRYRAAPEDRRIVSYGQVESVWPVTGSVLVRENVLYATAGRSSYLDGGMWLVRLQPQTGKLLGETRLYHRDPVTGEQPEDRINDVELPGALPDVLASHGDDIYLRDMRMDLTGKELEHDVNHLYSPVGFLDDNWWHRTYWIFGNQVFGRASGWSITAKYVPSGRILSTDGESIYGYGRANVISSGLGIRDVPMHLFKAARETIPRKGEKIKNNNKALVERLVPATVRYDWKKEIPLAVRGMVLTENALYVAGPVFENKKAVADPQFIKGETAALMVFNLADGKFLSRRDLDDQPVQDGLIATEGKLIMSTVAGTVECWSGQ